MKRLYESCDAKIQCEIQKTKDYLKDLECNPGVIWGVRTVRSDIRHLQNEYNQLQNKRIKLLLNPPLIKQNKLGFWNLMNKILRRK